LDAAARTYHLDNQPSLVRCFDDVVAACRRATTLDLSPTLGHVSDGDKAARPAPR
jgi:hypothetical protein